MTSKVCCLQVTWNTHRQQFVSTRTGNSDFREHVRLKIFAHIRNGQQSVDFRRTHVKRAECKLTPVGRRYLVAIGNTVFVNLIGVVGLLSWQDGDRGRKFKRHFAYAARRYAFQIRIDTSRKWDLVDLAMSQRCNQRVHVNTQRRKRFISSDWRPRRRTAPPELIFSCEKSLI